MCKKTRLPAKQVRQPSPLCFTMTLHAEIGPGFLRFHEEPLEGRQPFEATDALPIGQRMWTDVERGRVQMRRAGVPSYLVARADSGLIRSGKEPKEQEEEIKPTPSADCVECGDSIAHLSYATQRKYCLPCKEARERHHARNAPAIRRRFAKKRLRVALAVCLDAYAEHGSKCAHCPQDDYRVIDWHHTDRSEKEAEISKLLKHADLDALRAELAKCIPLCASCHRLVHTKDSMPARILAEILAETK